MRIDGSLPMHIARAYGAAPKPIAEKPVSAAPSSQVIGKIAPKPSAHVSNASKLVAAHVNQPIDFDRTAMPLAPNPAGALQLYTRAADRIEAAVAVEIGRQIDVRG